MIFDKLTDNDRICLNKNLKIKQMKKNMLNAEGIYRFLFTKNKVLSILEMPVTISGLEVKSPLQMNLHNLVQSDSIQTLSEIIFNYLRDKEIDAIVGYESPILAFMVANKLDIPLLIISEKERIEGIKDKKVAFVTNLITNGKDTINSLNVIKRHGGFCEEVCSAFDYNMNLDVDLKDVKINSVFDFSDIESLYDSMSEVRYILGTVMVWKENEQSLFGTANRKEVFESV